MDDLILHVKALLGKGDACVAMKNYSAAVDTYERALALDAKSVDATLCLGEAMAAAGNQDRALACFRYQ